MIQTEPQLQHRSNVVIFGDKGAGKSSLVNLILGSQTARIASDASSSTLDAKPYDVTIQDKLFRIYDTAGLHEAQAASDDPQRIGAINKAYRLVQSIADAGGIDLLILCVQKDRFTDTWRRNYKLFSEILCCGMVSVALIITHFDHGESEKRWTENLQIVKHACITANPVFNSVYEASRKKIHDLLLGHHNEQCAAREKVRRVVHVVHKTLEVVGIRSRFPSVREKTRMLGDCGLTEGEVQQVLRCIADMDADMAAMRKY